MSAELAKGEEAVLFSGGRGTENDIPCGFTVVVDTREPPHTAYRFEGIPAIGRRRRGVLAVKSARRSLGEGDYSVEGLTDYVAVERKEANDFLGCLTAGRRRFERELERLQWYEWSAVVVEAPLESFTQGYYRSKVSPASIFATWIAWEQRFPGTHWHFLPNKMHAERLTFRLLDRFWRDHKHNCASKLDHI